MRCEYEFNSSSEFEGYTVMRMKNITLAAAASVLVGLGTAGQAAASVYGGSKLDVSNLTVDFLDASGAPITGAVTGFTFNVEDSATLNGANDGNAAGCGQLNGGTDCSTTAPVLKVPAANAPGSSPLRSNGDYSLFGPGSGQYANSNAEITAAELVTNNPTSTKQVSEAEITDDGQGQASTNIQSNTSFRFNFALDQTGSVVLSFNADPSMQALVDLPAGQSGLAQSNIGATFTLNGLDGQGSASWSPQGTAANDCVTSGGVTCVEDSDGADLNNNLGVGPSNSNLTYFPGSQFFGLTVDNLAAGRYTLTLAALTSVNVRKATVPVTVPEPGTLLLLGAGLVMVGGFAGKVRRRGGRAA